MKQRSKIIFSTVTIPQAKSVSFVLDVKKPHKGNNSFDLLWPKGFRVVVYNQNSFILVFPKPGGKVEGLIFRNLGGSCGFF